MKLLILTGSYRHSGNTATAAKLFEDEIRALFAAIDIEVQAETVHLAHQNIQPCRGCRLCFDKGEHMCANKDDVLEIRNKMLDADLLVMASPIYVEDVSGMMKMFIDRLAFLCHRPAFFGKAAFVITTSGMGATNHTYSTMARALLSWGYVLAGRLSIKAGALMCAEDMKKLYQSKFKKAALRAMRHIVKQAKPSFLSLMSFYIQQKYYLKQADKTSVDYIYWLNNGWLERSRIHYTVCRASAKAAAARLCGMLIAKFVLK